MMMLAAAGLALLVERLLARRADPPIEVWRDVCPRCGHAEDAPDRVEVLARMRRHTTACQAQIGTSA